MLPLNISLTALTVVGLLVGALWVGIKKPFGTSLTTLIIIAALFGLALLTAIFFELQLVYWALTVNLR